MAKNQQLPLNPDEISGVCGRLLCCLSYEDDLYKEANKKMPKIGSEVVTPQGKGRVRHLHPLKESITVMLENNVLTEFTVEELISGKKSGGSCGTCGGCTVKRRSTAEEDNAKLLAERAQMSSEKVDTIAEDAPAEQRQGSSAVEGSGEKGRSAQSSRRRRRRGRSGGGSPS